MGSRTNDAAERGVAGKMARLAEISDLPSPGDGLDIVSVIGPDGSKLWARLIRIERNASTTCAASS